MTAGEGAEQGDVWGPILYSLALAPCVPAFEEDRRDKLRTAGWEHATVTEAIGSPQSLWGMWCRRRPGRWARWGDG